MPTDINNLIDSRTKIETAFIEKKVPNSISTSSFNYDDFYKQSKVDINNKNKLSQSFSSGYSTDEEIMKLLRSHGLYRRADIDLYGSMFRFGCMDPYNIVNSTREYVFFTKPDLNIYSADKNLNSGAADINGGKVTVGLDKNPFFVYLHNHGYEQVLQQLCLSYSGGTGPFMNLLFNRRTSNIDLQDISSDDIETNMNYFGTKFRYRRGTEKSDEEQDFSCEFEDTANLEVYLLFKAYDEYERMKWYGLIAPRKEYIKNKVIHDQFGVFRFIVAEDGESILHWSQFFGVFPTNVPRSSFSDMPQDGHLKFTINFKAQFVSDMEPNTLSDFNHLISKYYTNFNNMADFNNIADAKIWDDSIQSVNGDKVIIPYISFDNQTNISGFRHPKLKWKTRSNYG